MANGMTRREFGIAAGAASLAGFGLSARAKAADAKTLRFIAQSDLRVLDPIWTTAYVTRNHSYMVFDTLFSTNAKFEAVPQMAEGLSTENDGKLVKIKLRDGLKFHDGEKVLAKDCVASIQRFSEATQSAPRTACPSWNLRPSRRVKL